MVFVFVVCLILAFIRYHSSRYYEVVRISASDGQVLFVVKAKRYWEYNQGFNCSVELIDSYIGASDGEAREFSVVESIDGTVVGLFERSSPRMIIVLVDVTNKCIWTGSMPLKDDARLMNGLNVLRNDHNIDYVMGDLGDWE